MKIISLFFFLVSFNLYAGTCATTSRTNYSSGQTLTSSALNADFNQLVTKVNAFDGGCVSDGTLEAASLNASDFAAVTNGIHQGCAVDYSDANTVSIGKCILSVNGTFVKTTASNTVTWGCSGCASELASTLYYVYVKSGTSGTSLAGNLLISTTAPGTDGYDGSGNKVLGSFYNNSSSAIERKSIRTWAINKLSGQNKETFSFAYGDTSTTACSASPCAYVDQTESQITSIERVGTGTYKLNFSKTYVRIDCFAQGVNGSGVPFAAIPASNVNADNATFGTYAVSPYGLTNTFGAGYCIGVF